MRVFLPSLARSAKFGKIVLKALADFPLRIEDRMKLIVDKLGPIDHAEIDVRNLTVFVGPNGTGKTWTAHALYGMACLVTRWRFVQIVPRTFLSQQLFDLTKAAADRVLARLGDHSVSEIGTEIDRKDILGAIDRDVEFELDEGMIAEVLQVDRSSVEGASSRLLLDPTEFTRSVHDVLKINVNRAESIVNLTLEKKGASPYLASKTFSPLADIADEEGFDGSLKQIVDEFVGHLIFRIFDSAAPFPTEREAIVSSQASALMGSHTRSLEQTSFFTSPTADFFWMMQNLGNRPVNAREQSDFSAAATLLEDRILEGKLVFAKGKSGPFRPLKYVFGDGLELGMHAASSMVRSLAGLDLYLRFIAKRGSIIVIDEPEMNAHPEAQLKIIEFLAILANTGLRVVFTTHSPYIMDHLNNLMTASSVPEGRKQEVADGFKLGRPESFTSPEKVSAYLFHENGTVEDVLDRAEGVVHLSTFGSETEFMANLIHTILDAAEEEPKSAEELHAV